MDMYIFYLKNFIIFIMSTRVFLKRHFEMKKKNPTQYATGGDLGRMYPEGEGDLTSLEGPQRHLKFGKK